MRPNARCGIAPRSGSLCLAAALGCAPAPPPAMDAGSTSRATGSSTDGGAESASTAADWASTGTTGATLEDGSESGVVWATGTSSSGTTMSAGVYERVMEPLIQLRCLGMCHGLNWDLVLAVGEGYDNLVNVPSDEVPWMMRVVPGDPAASYLWHKVNGTYARVGGTGEQMPRATEPLDPEELAIIEMWILDGAPR